MSIIPKELKQIDAMLDKFGDMKGDVKAGIAALDKMAEAMEKTAPVLNALADAVSSGRTLADAIDRSTIRMERISKEVIPKLDSVEHKLELGMELAKRLTEK